MRIVLAFIIVLISFTSFPVRAADADEHESVYVEIVSNCEKGSQAKWDTGISIEMRQGSYDYVDCLFSAIEEVSEVYFVKLHMTDRDEFLSSIKSMMRSAYDVYNAVEQGFCSPCGTQQQLFPTMHIAGQLEDLLKVMLLNHSEYELGSE